MVRSSWARAPALSPAALRRIASSVEASEKFLSQGRGVCRPHHGKLSSKASKRAPRASQCSAQKPGPVKLRLCRLGWMPQLLPLSLSGAWAPRARLSTYSTEPTGASATRDNSKASRPPVSNAHAGSRGGRWLAGVPRRSYSSCSHCVAASYARTSRSRTAAGAPATIAVCKGK